MKWNPTELQHENKRPERSHQNKIDQRKQSLQDANIQVYPDT